MKKLVIFCVIILTLLFAGVLPRYARIDSSVVHQHKADPGENGESTGFDENGNLTSHLPLVILKNNGQGIPGAEGVTEEVLYCDFAVIDRGAQIHSSADAPTQTGKMAVNIRGNSSRFYPKKQYALRTVDEAGLPVDTALLGMPAESSWVLNGSYIDISQLRNYMLYNISGEIMEYAPRCRLCEVFLTNDQGALEYQGLYTLIEKPSVNVERLNLTKYDPKFAETAFVLQMNRRISDIKIEHLIRCEDTLFPYNLEYPDGEVLTDASLEYITDEILRFEKTLYDASFTGNWKIAENQMDADSFADYYIINEFFQNYDAGNRSTYLYRDLGNKFHMGPVWDFDGTFNNFRGIDMDIDDLNLKESIFYYYLLQDPDFADLCIRRYRELRKTVLSDRYLLEYIEETGEYLGSAALRNCDKWYKGDYASYRQELEKMKAFVLDRGKWMDENFEERTTVAG